MYLPEPEVLDPKPPNPDPDDWVVLFWPKPPKPVLPNPDMVKTLADRLGYGRGTTHKATC